MWRTCLLGVFDGVLAKKKPICCNPKWILHHSSPSLSCQVCNYNFKDQAFWAFQQDPVKAAPFRPCIPFWGAFSGNVKLTFGQNLRRNPQYFGR